MAAIIFNTPGIFLEESVDLRDFKKKKRGKTAEIKVASGKDTKAASRPINSAVMKRMRCVEEEHDRNTNENSSIKKDFTITFLL